MSTCSVSVSLDKYGGAWCLNSHCTFFLENGTQVQVCGSPPSGRGRVAQTLGSLTPERFGIPMIRCMRLARMEHVSCTTSPPPPPSLLFTSHTHTTTTHTTSILHHTPLHTNNTHNQPNSVGQEEEEVVVNFSQDWMCVITNNDPVHSIGIVRCVLFLSPSETRPFCVLPVIRLAPCGWCSSLPFAPFFWVVLPSFSFLGWCCRSPLLGVVLLNSLFWCWPCLSPPSVVVLCRPIRQ